MFMYVCMFIYICMYVYVCIRIYVLMYVFTLSHPPKETHNTNLCMFAETYYVHCNLASKPFCKKMCWIENRSITYR